MPFTPFHMGPALAIKSLAGPHFSLLIFGLSQIFMDLEPLVRLINHDPIVHGWSHTYLGATIIAPIAIFAGKAPFQFLLAQLIIAETRENPHSLLLKWFQITSTITWTAAISGAFIGTYSHVLLDSMIHSDLTPWLPLTQANPMLDLMTNRGVQRLCIITGLLGALAILITGIIRTQRESSAPHP